MGQELVLFLFPNFPPNWGLFVKNLVTRGAKVVAIGDAPWEHISDDLKKDLAEYYRVWNGEDYSQIRDAVVFLQNKHGRFTRVSSHNEHWLRLEARIRTEFNIPNGYTLSEIENKQKKSFMKTLFHKANVNTPRGKVLSSEEELLEFVKEIGYPLCAKPNTGVGGYGAVKLKNEEHLRDVWKSISKDKEYIVEEYIEGRIVTFDGIVDAQGEIVWYGSFEVTKNIMETMTAKDDSSYFIQRTVPTDLIEAGSRIVKKFEIRNVEFFHIEFFRRASDNSLVALEVNMRPPGKREHKKG
eukprot:TRINITY_DN6360_c0_g2_i5.p1 TRINITY_DN6360_c0_g2~~TRINITY_DN6360_c0_g2_i5.p1  ORF type:complete len:309 (-),score=55.90 TRINITY_DN6360_c0_g2_i5:96-986(-)